MLMWAGGDPEPCVVGQVQHPPGPVMTNLYLGREDYLIADQHDGRWQARQVEDLGRGTWMEIDPASRQLRETKQPPKRHIFAEGNQVAFVICDRDLALSI